MHRHNRKKVIKLIVVNVSEQGITIDGHAGYSGKGKDIVCAAVSVLAQNLICSMGALTGDRITYQIREGHIDIVYKDLSGKGKLLVDSFFIGICKVQEVYEDCIQIR